MANKQTTSNLIATISNLVEGATKPELGVLVRENTQILSPTKFGEATARIELESIKKGLREMEYSNSEVNTVIRNYRTLLKQKLREISTRRKEGGEIINTRIESIGECLYIILENHLLDRNNPALELELTSIVSKLPEYLESIVKNLSEAQDKEKPTNPFVQVIRVVGAAFTTLVNQGRGKDGNERK
jgi:hypothetical protein